MTPSGPLSRPGQTGYRPLHKAMTMDNELIIVGAFLSAGLLAYVLIPGLLVMWDRVLDYMGSNVESEKK